MHITIIGAGNFGKALAAALHHKNTLHLWDALPGKVAGQGTLAEAVKESEIIFLAVPSLAVRQTCATIAQAILPHAVVVSVSKSLEAGTRMTADQILEETLKPQQPIAFMGGPMLAREIAEGKAAIAVCATAHREHFARIKKAFRKSSILVERSSDMRGVAACGVLKNVYTLPVGIASGLSLGNNTVGWLVGRGMLEMQKLLPLLGGKKKTLFSTAGIGDFVATATSPHSMNHRAGEEIAKTGTAATHSEGIVALPTLVALLGGDLKKFPLLLALDAIVAKKADPAQTLNELISKIK